MDRTLLPDPDRENTLLDRAFVAPKSALEERVASIVAGLLGVEQVSAEDNFFLLGGDSLLGAQLMVKVENEFGLRLSLPSLFEAPSVAMLSAEIETRLLAKLEAMSEEEAQRLLDLNASAAESNL